MFSFFFFNDTATTEIYTLSLHDALPILPRLMSRVRIPSLAPVFRAFPTHHSWWNCVLTAGPARSGRSEEHTSELQSRLHLVCRLLLEKKKNKHYTQYRLHQYDSRYLRRH